jgi:hypothetical protein
VRNIIVKTIPKGTLLFTYFMPNRSNTKEANIGEYLNTFSCPNIWYNPETKKYEYCLSPFESVRKYFYNVPFLSNGIDDWGSKYSNVSICVTKYDLRVVYGKSGTVIEDNTFNHKGNVVSDFKRLVTCNKLKGACIRGDGSDMCLVPDFAYSQRIDGIEQFSGQDVLIQLNNKKNEFYFSGRGQMLDLVKTLVNEIHSIQSKVIPENPERYSAVVQEIAELEANLEANLMETNPILNGLYDEERLVSNTKHKIKMSYAKTNEAIAADLKALGFTPTYPEEMPNNYVPFNPTSKENQEKINKLNAQETSLRTRIGSLQEKIGIIRRKIYNLKREEESLNPENLKKWHQEYLTMKKYLDFIFLTLDADHRGINSFYGFSELVFNPFGYRSFSTENFLPPSEDGLYELLEQTETNQTVTIEPQHLQAFLEKYVYPKNILEPIGLVTEDIAVPPPNLTDSSQFPNLDAGVTIPYSAIKLYDKCMKYLLNTYKVFGGPPRIMYDTRTNLFQVLQFTSPYPYENRFSRGPGFLEGRDTWIETLYPNSFSIEVTESAEDGTVQLSQRGLDYATKIKIVKLLWAQQIKDTPQKSFDLYVIPFLEYVSMIGPFSQKFFHKDSTRNVHSNLLQLFDIIDGEKSKVFALKQFLQDSDVVEASRELTNKNWLGRYRYLINDDEYEEANSNSTSNSKFTSFNSAINYYSVLGIPRNANTATIKKAYRKRAIELHHNKGGTTENFQKLQIAFKILSDPAKRANYNAQVESTSTEPVAAIANARRGGYRHRRTQKKKGNKNRRKTRGRR